MVKKNFFQKFEKSIIIPNSSKDLSKHCDQCCSPKNQPDQDYVTEFDKDNNGNFTSNCHDDDDDDDDDGDVLIQNTTCITEDENTQN